MTEYHFESTGSYGDDIKKSEEMFLAGLLEKLPEWHPITHMYDEEITPEFLKYLRKVWRLEKDLRPVRDAMFLARRSKDDEAELAACRDILSAWMAFTPLKKQAIERFEADYYIDRMSIILVRLARTKEAIDIIETYYGSSFYDHLRHFRSSRHQAIEKRLARAQNMAKKTGQNVGFWDGEP